MISAFVTVVVPVFNMEKFLDRTLKSILRQTYRNFECIIVNDASTDKSADIALKYVRRYKRFRQINHRTNAGPNAARNTGLRAARGELICFLDADDLMMEDALRLRVDAIFANAATELAGTYCRSVKIDETVEIPPPTTPAQQLNIVDFITAKGACPFNVNQPMMRTCIMRSLGGFDEKLIVAEDYDMWMRILRAGYFFAPTPFNAVTYRARQNSRIRNDPLKHLNISTCLFELAHSHLSETSEHKDAPSMLMKPWIFYKKQLEFYDRTLEFLGMALVNGSSIDGIVENIKHNIPDIFGIISYHRNFSEKIKVGIARQSGKKFHKLPSNVRQKLDKNINDITLKLKKELENQTHSASLKMPENNLSDANLFEKILWHPGFQKEIDLIVLPHKDYHVWTFSLLIDVLKKQGVRSAVVDLSAQYRDEGVRSKAAELGIPLIGYGNFALGNFRPKAILAFNDWDPIVRSIFIAAQHAGISTICLVEGINDYDDADTGRTRNAYRTAEHVLLPGQFDKKYFTETHQKVFVTGIPRIAALRKVRKKPRFPKQPVALINSNFSYGVLEDVRDWWLEQAVEACKEAGIIPVITRHPADMGTLFPELITTDDFYTAVENSTIVIQRFASGILESLAMGKPVIYFNPHNEKVDKFKRPLGAYVVSESKADLVQQLGDLNSLKLDLKNRDRFLDLHAGSKETDTIKETADTLSHIIKRYSKQADYTKFRKNLSLIDIHGSSMSDVRRLRKTFAATFGVKITSLNPARKTSERIWDRVARQIPKQQLEQKIRLKTTSQDDKTYIALAERYKKQALKKRTRRILHQNEAWSILSYYSVLLSQRPIHLISRFIKKF